MNLVEYRNNALRTTKDLGSLTKNQTHYFLGVLTEIGEFVDTFKKNLAYGKEVDNVNVSEEWGDTMWYIVGASSVAGISDETLNKEWQIHLDTDYTEIRKICEEYAANMQLSFETAAVLVMSTNILRTMITFSEDQIEFLISQAFCLAALLNINIEESFDKNIAKLKIRYPDGFTEESALNRDLSSERQTLES